MSDQVHELASVSLMEHLSEAILIPEPEPSQPCMEFDQVREPVHESIPVCLLVEYEGMMWSPILTSTAEKCVLNSRMSIIEEEKKISTMPVSLPNTKSVSLWMLPPCLPLTPLLPIP